MDKYIGIVKRGERNSCNYGLIFEEQEDGTFICKQIGLTLNKLQIKNDLNLGYLKPYKDGQIFQNTSRIKCTDN
jgi:hypothetical protein